MAIIVYIHCFDCFCTSKGSRTVGGSSRNEICCYCPGGYGGNILYIFAYPGWHSLFIDACDQVPLILPKMQGRNRRHPIHTHCQDGVVSVSCCLFPMKTANKLFMTVCNLLPPRIPKIHNQQLLMLRWRLFSRWGREHVAFSFSYKGSQ